MLNSVLNIENKSYASHAYHVELGYYHAVNTVIFADNTGDVLDILIDHLEENEEKHPEYFMSDSDESLLSEEEREDFICGGNYGRMTTFTVEELRIREIDFNSEILIEIKD